jgi:hypothetical protein
MCFSFMQCSFLRTQVAEHDGFPTIAFPKKDATGFQVRDGHKLLGADRVGGDVAQT